jgi:hypothetical protein
MAVALCCEFVLFVSSGNPVLFDADAQVLIDSIDKSDQY